MKCYWTYEYPMGVIGIAETDGSITHLFFESNADKNAPSDFERRETPLIKKAAKQLKEYYAGKRREFDLPLEFAGTDFQKLVWAALLTIPYGETRSYGQIAAQIGKPKAARAVGMANNRNPISIIIPCHRVIGHDGKLVGYGGGLPLKQHLLELERLVVLGR